MIRLKIYTENSSFGRNQIKWNIEPTSENLTAYVLDLYVSEFSTREFVPFVSGLNLYTEYKYTHQIESGLLYHGFRHWWYSGLVRNTTSGKIRGTNVVSMDQELDHVGMEIVRRKGLALRRHVYMGEPFYLLSHRTYGTSCANCWDETLQQRTLEKCPICYDTAWSGGYYAPEKFYATASIGTLRDQLAFWGDWRPGDCELITLNEPDINLKDIIVDESGDRWKVISLIYTSKSGANVVQRAQLRRVPYDDIVYSFPIPEFSEEEGSEHEY